MKKALYRHKSLPSVEMSRKRRERGGKPLTKKIENVKQWITTLYKKRSFAANRIKYGRIEKCNM